MSKIEKIKKYLSKNTQKVETKMLVTNACLKKFCMFEGKSAALIDEQKIKRDQQWDGLHGVITNSDKSSQEVLMRYKDLWQIEESFRISKTNLKIRPNYHYKPSRIRSHVGICFLSLCLVRHMQVRLKRANINFSFQKIQEELKRVQYSICKDYSTGIRFKVPSSLNPIASEIYAALGLKRKDSMSVYQN